MNERTEFPFPLHPGEDATEARKTTWTNHQSFAILSIWHKNLEADKGERAAMRRAASLTEVMLSPAFHRLLRELRSKNFGIPENRYPQLAAIAGLAAGVKAIDIPQTLADRMGQPKAGGKTSTVAELRMRNILACDDVETLYTLLRRALALLDNRANLADLAAIVWHWSRLDAKRPNDPRRRMAYDYYAAAPL